MLTKSIHCLIKIRFRSLNIYPICRSNWR
jgi:hypothetical protein